MDGAVPRSGWTSHFQSMILGLLAIAACAALAPLLILPLAWKEQAVFGAIVVVIAMFLNRASRSLAVTTLLMAFSVFSTLRYGWWRVTQTWEGITSAGHIHRWDNVFVLLLLGAEFFAFATLVLGYFQTLRPLKRPPLPLEGDPADWPTVDVLIPTYNEPLHVVSGTVLAAAALDYPAGKMRVLLLDDGRRDEFRQFAAQVGVEYITRDNNRHAKAGNINHALGRISGEYVAIFDSDHVPARSFLRSALGWFLQDRALGLVQTPHHFYSPDPFERNLGHFRTVPNEGELFHRLVQDGNDLWNASFFCGSCAVLRRTALDDIGGIAVETVTEDAHTALRMQSLGWNTAYINIPKAAGLATESLAAHIGQRIRWARGMTQILRIENPLFASGLTLSQRLCYFNATTHFLFAVPRLIFLTIPLVYLLFGKVNIYGYTWAIVAYAIPHLVLATLTNSRIQGRYRYSFWNEIYEVVLSPYILFPTLLALINPKLGRFNVTSKGGVIRRSYFDRRIALPYLLLLALNVAGLVKAENRYFSDPAHRGTVIMNGAWALYNTMILSVAASVALERRKLRSGAYVRARIPATLKSQASHSLESDGPLDGATAYLSRDSVVVRLDAAVDLARGAPVLLALGEGRFRSEFVALVAHSAGRRQHLFLLDLTSEQEADIEDLLRSRRKAWRSLRNSQPVDHPLRSLLQIFFLAIRGFAILPVVFLLPRPSDDDAPIPPRRRGRMPSIIAPVILLASLFLAPQLEAQTWAGRSTANHVRETQAANFHDQFDLGALSNSKTLSLQQSGASLSFFFQEPVTKVSTDAVLTLSYAAPHLHSNEARLEVTINGASAGSIALVPGSSQEAQFALPTDLLTNDNTLSLQLQGTCVSCRATAGPWVTLSPASTVSLGGTRLPLANDLSLLPLPFYDPAGLRSWDLPVVFGDHPDDTTLQGAALVASWFGVLSDVRGVHFPITVGELPSGNAVVFALRGSELLTGLSLPSEPGPLVAMRENPRDPYGKLLIVTGDRPEDLLEAARALTSAAWLPHVDHIRAHAVPVAAQPVYAAPRWLQTGEPSSIGTYTTAEHLKLQGTGSINLYFRLPPDLFLRARQSVPLLLRFEYSGAPQEARPALSVRLNGQDIDSVQLQPASGPVEASEVFRLPTGGLHAYINTLTVDFYFGAATPPAAVRPSLAVDRNSSIDLRGLPHSVVLPRLELFADAGYPFTRRPDCGDTAVIMPNTPSPADLETLLDMAGFFGAQSGALATGLEVVDSDHQLDQAEDKDLVLIGTPESQPLLSEWAGRIALDLNRPEMRVNQAPEQTLLLHPEWPFREHDGERLTRLLDFGVGNISLFVQSFVSPLHPNRVVVAVIPSGSHALDAVRALFTPSEREGPVYGGVAVFQNGHFESFLAGTLACHTGKLTDYQYVTVLLLENYRLLPLLLLFLSLLIVAWVRWSTERVAARRLAAP